MNLKWTKLALGCFFVYCCSKHSLYCVVYQGEEGDQGEPGEAGVQGPPVKYF